MERLAKLSVQDALADFLDALPIVIAAGAGQSCRASLGSSEAGRSLEARRDWQSTTGGSSNLRHPVKVAAPRSAHLPRRSTCDVVAAMPPHRCLRFDSSESNAANPRPACLFPPQLQAPRLPALGRRSTVSGFFLASALKARGSSGSGKPEGRCRDSNGSSMIAVLLRRVLGMTRPLSAAHCNID